MCQLAPNIELLFVDAGTTRTACVQPRPLASPQSRRGGPPVRMRRPSPRTSPRSRRLEETRLVLTAQLSAATGEVIHSGPDRRGACRFLSWPYHYHEG
jgi:hypothetical protein